MRRFDKKKNMEKVNKLFEQRCNEIDENIEQYSTEILWIKFKDSSWNINGEKVTLEMISNGDYKDSNNENIRTIYYWYNKYKNEGVDENDYLILSNDGDDTLLDGYHRLTAAKMVGINTLPVIFDDSNFKQI